LSRSLNTAIMNIELDEMLEIDLSKVYFMIKLDSSPHFYLFYSQNKYKSIL